MPKVTKSKESRTPDGSELFIFNYDGERVLVKRSQIRCYWDAVRTCRKLFSEIPEDYRIIFNTKNLAICDNEMAVISHDAWDVIIGQLSSVVITVEKPKVTVVRDNSKGPGISSSEAPRDAKICLKVSTCSGIATKKRSKTTFNLRAPRSTTISRVCESIGVKTNKDPTRLRLFHAGTRLHLYGTLESNDIEDGDEILCLLEQIGGKPVIYLSSPTPIKASVKLSLAAQWDFSAIYPVVPIKPRTNTTNQEVSWEVEVHPNGDLTELTTGLDVAYLFWEAHTNTTTTGSNKVVPTLPPSPPPCPSSNASIEEVFYPNNTDLTDADSVVLPVDKITPYLDKALTALCLHTEARTSFITYWLPSLLKHKHVALRFVSQKAYEHAAPLAVSPAPDVITRVFMVFKGIAEDELDQWSAAVNRASAEVGMWRNIVGVDSERAHDATLFRVLEWGGMEVLPLANPVQRFNNNI